MHLESGSLRGVPDRSLIAVHDEMGDGLLQFGRGHPCSAQTQG
jgi:hypothetical protein